MINFEYTDNENNTAVIECLASVFTSNTNQCELVAVPPGILNTVTASVTHEALEGPGMEYQVDMPPFFTFNATSDISIGFEGGTPMYSINLTFIGHFERIEVEFTNGDKITQGTGDPFKIRRPLSEYLCFNFVMPTK